MQSFIHLHRSSAREVSYLTRILMTKSWLSSEAARRSSRVSTLVEVWVQDQGLTRIHDHSWQGCKPILVKYTVLDTYKVYMLDMAGGEEVWSEVFLPLLHWQKELNSWALTVPSWDVIGRAGICNIESGWGVAWTHGGGNTGASSFPSLWDPSVLHYTLCTP